MNYLQVVHSAVLTTGFRAYFFLVLSSFTTVAITGLVNTVTEFDPDVGVRFDLLFAFVIVAMVTIVSRHEAGRVLNAVGEGLSHHMRMRFSVLLQHADYIETEKIGVTNIYTTLARNTMLLAESPATLGKGIASFFSFVIATLYVAYLSWVSALLVVCLIWLIYLSSRFRHSRTRDSLESGQRAEQSFFEAFNHNLRGLKEMQMDSNRASDLLENHLKIRAVQTRNYRLSALNSMLAFSVIVIASFYLMLATVTFIAPQFVTYTTDAMKVVYVSAVMWMMIEEALSSWPVFEKGSAAYNELRRMEEHLVNIQKLEGSSEQRLEPLLKLELDSIHYTFPQSIDESNFHIGPCSLSLEPGKTVFIVGENGSGKTTLLRILCGLYTQYSGNILWNGECIDDDSIVAYRNRIAAVFADFHLFDRAYGNPTLSDERVMLMLERVGLEKKTKFLNGRFTNLDLSTGQRKRVALAMALLEDKEIYVFDEIAAEQDPEFRKKVYLEFIPELKEKGKSVLVISHDDRYFDTADIIYYMSNGSLAQQQEVGMEQ